MNNELVLSGATGIEEKKPLVNILIFACEAHQERADELKKILNEWACAETWNSVTKDSRADFLSLRGKLFFCDIAVFLVTSDVVDVFTGDTIKIAKDNLLFEIVLAYSYLGRRNSIIIVDEENEKSSSALSLLEPSLFFYHNFEKSMDILASKIEWHCNEDPRYSNVREKNNLPATNRLKEHYAKVEMNIFKSLIVFSTAKDHSKPPTINNIEGNILKRYLFPTSYGDKEDTEVEILLVERENIILLTDQGKTMDVLDKIFELGEPDVIKNLEAIMKHYNAKKVRKEIIVEISTWHDNPNEDENSELREAVYRLYSCLMFMANMKIFYV